MAPAPLDHNGIFISWIPHHGRSHDLAEHLGAACYFIYPKGSRLTRYLRSTCETLRVLAHSRPDVVFVMVPPVFALLPVLAWTSVHRKQLVVDAHTGAITARRWVWSVPFLRRICRMKSVTRGIIVTTHELAQVGRIPGAIELHDPVPASVGSDSGGDDSAVVPPGDFVLFAGGSVDEPLDLLSEVAEHLTIPIVATGRLRGVAASPSPNLILTGYVSGSMYRELMRRCSAVLALTNEELTMQRAAYEALSLAKPMVLSDRSVLREYFEDAAIYCANSVPDVGLALVECLRRSDELRDRLINLRDDRTIEWKEQFSAACERLAI